MNVSAKELADQIANAIVAHKVEENKLSYLIEYVINYHLQGNEIPRDKCTWGCSRMDESNPDDWYDGFLCGGCGYVRGMGLPVAEQLTRAPD